MSNSSQLSYIKSVISVRQNGIRSINVEFDLGNNSVVEGYVLTAQARASLARILNAFIAKSPSRSWTLTGPYGSGKSFFGLFMMNLMGKAQIAHEFAFKQLQDVDTLLATHLSNVLNHGSTKGLMPIPITGYRTSFQECIKHGFSEAIEHLNNGDINIGKLSVELDKWSIHTESRTVIQWLDRYMEIITQPKYGYSGALLVFDEMGKPLEFAAFHPDEADIYLLQELAEFANRSVSRPFIFVGILHQAFEQYANLLDSKTQREWSKVQGRFEDIPFQEPVTQQIHLLANALEYSEEVVFNPVVSKLSVLAQEAADTGWCPPMMKAGDFTKLAEKSYPFHPTTLVALPYLFRRLAQNERSIFAYLSSNEPAGFQEFIEQHFVGSMIMLPDLFDYLAFNFQARLYSTGRARAITETIERLAGANNLNELEILLLKTIGIINWLAEVSSLQANEASIISALESKKYSAEDIRGAIRRTKVRSLIIYRRFNKTYSIWQGSDVDIEDRLSQAQQHLRGSFSLAEAVQKYMTPRPVVARRHSFQTGTLRYFQIEYVDTLSREHLEDSLSPNVSGKVLLCLPNTYGDAEEFINWATSPEITDKNNVVLGVAERTGRLAELLYELRCLHWVDENTPELRDDPVARRELRTRLITIETMAQNDIDRVLSPYRLSNATGGKWFYKGKEIQDFSNQNLSHLLSNICDEIYHLSPSIWNEIINRRQLSSQGAAARRNLIEAMLTQENKENLGIEGFPPERSMYDSLLKASGLHHQINDVNWGFASLKKNASLNLYPTWQAISDFIFIDIPEPRSIDELFGILSVPPFGLTEGVLPIILCAFLIVNQGETTLYQDGSLLPEPSIASWELLLRRPELFSVAGCRVTGTRSAIVERLAKGYQVEPKVMPIVRALIKGISSLPEHTNRTNRLSEHALAIRSKITQARSPESLLFIDLPTAVGIPSFEHQRLIPEQVDIFFERLNKAFSELINEMPRLLTWGRDKLLVACDLHPSDDGWNAFRTIATDLIDHVTNPNLLPMLKRASETTDSMAALESVLAYIANRPPRTWTDDDTDRFLSRAKTLGELFQVEHQAYITDVNLTPNQRKQSHRIIDNLQQYIKEQFADDPKVIRVALQSLLEQYMNKPDR